MKGIPLSECSSLWGDWIVKDVDEAFLGKDEADVESSELPFWLFPVNSCFKGVQATFEAVASFFTGVARKYRRHKFRTKNFQLYLRNVLGRPCEKVSISLLDENHGRLLFL